MSGASEKAPIDRRFTLQTGTDPQLSAGALWWGPGDPQMQLGPDRLARAMRLASGPATLVVAWRGSRVTAQAWGEGATEALDLAPGLVGDLDDAPALVAHHPIVGELARRLPGLRLTRGAPVVEMLVNSIIGQKVTGLEARRSQRLLLAQLGEPAPGPCRLRVLPPPEQLARIPYWAFHPLGLERRRADTIRAAAAIAPRLEQIRYMTADDARRRLESVPGVGPWSAHYLMMRSYGFLDCVPVGDTGLTSGLKEFFALDVRPDKVETLALMERFSPYRSLATFHLWQRHGTAA